MTNSSHRRLDRELPSMSRPRSTTSPPQIVASSPEGQSRPADLEAQQTIHSPQLARASDDLERRVRSPTTKGDSLDIVNRRIQRSQTSRSYRPKLAGRQWKPGAEPGIDPAGPQPGTAPVGLREECQITVVDYSQQDMEVRELDNGQLAAFLDEGRDEGLTCRWINVNGLSWDVISMLGREKKLHKLAIEDMLNRRNRTKADWYADHTYLVLPLQKLIQKHDFHLEHDEHSETTLAGPAADVTHRPPDHSETWTQRIARAFGGGQKQRRAEHEMMHAFPPGAEHLDEKLDAVDDHTMPVHAATTGAMRTLQRYNGGPNLERTDYMEANSALRVKGLAVGVEQVSIFLLADNTVISFFETSADDIEAPIINRLSSRETILRRTADASMLVQAILDAVIDLAIPVAAAYKDAMDELELNVLTEPKIKHTRSLYIMISEIVSFRANIYPVTNLINALRDHKANQADAATATSHEVRRHAQSADSSVVINPATYNYLKDVEDHIFLVTDNLDQMRRAADNMIDLIFNTLSAFQNESMRQLTIVTIIFLPMSFLTGYFGMNFGTGQFYALTFSDAFFWWVAAPVGTATAVFLLRDSIYRYFVKIRQRRHIASTRKRRKHRLEAKTKKI